MTGYYRWNIDELTKERSNSAKTPFEHQSEAFSALSKTLHTPISGYKGALLVLPTGGGKTFTSINWICRNIISKGVKVLWLAQSSYLIDQATDTFFREIHNATGRDTVNLRVVSSSTSHANSGSIAPTDDILVTTTQTAISAYSSEQLDGSGNAVKTPLRKFVDNCKDTELFVVIDEAHHTPAYGCRTLLLSMREEIANLYILGLTATPTHTDKRISGWLKNIYSEWICYEAKKEDLQERKILAVPHYIERNTNLEFEVDDNLFDRLVKMRKDLPENIIEDLAKNHSRNDMIIKDYLDNQDEYGKTLIFADRWFQCEYIVDKLKAQGIRVNAVYNVISGQDTVYQGGSGRRNNKENEQIMQDFRDGKYDVIVNVKMLTEGVDVPDVKTVMITRQTTSNILLTQMIGRALRGEKTGGSKDANIVFFYDTWRYILPLPWANFDGNGLENNKPNYSYNPMQLISVHLIKLACEDIPYNGFENVGFLTFIPVGFYNCEYIVSVIDDDLSELAPHEEKICVYDFCKENYENMISDLCAQDLSQYANENIIESRLEEKAETLKAQYFNPETDNFDGQLIGNITKIARHIAQNNTAPLFIDFNERDVYDMDRLADELIDVSQREIDITLRNIFNDEGKRWQSLYKNYSNFKNAFDKSMNRIFNTPDDTKIILHNNAEQADELTEEIKEQTRKRDNYICLCCGKDKKKGKRVKLQVDHIRPVSMGGSNAISNLQTLCFGCNHTKGINEIDYRVNKTPLQKPKENLELFNKNGTEDISHILSRIINQFYHCKAVCSVNYNLRSNGKNYDNWEIILFSGNNPDWLLTHEDELLNYIKNNLKCPQVVILKIRN